MFEIIVAGGWLMVPIILCSIIAMAIVAERFWSLRADKVAPKQLTAQVWQWYHSGQLNGERLKGIEQSSGLGRMLVTGIANMRYGREVMKERIEDTGRYVIHDLERYLTALGTIAAVSPLLGLLGSVTGLMKVFSAVTQHGVGNPQVLAGGISEIMVATAAGLVVAIPSVIFYRYFQRRVDDLAITMEQEVLKLIDAAHAESHAAPAAGQE